MEQVYTPKQNNKVLVNCITYNQSKYIEDALNGFAMQKTDFPFVCLVMDDASTDGEQEVIKAWMERECDMGKAEYIDVELSNIILVPHIHNANCTFALYFLKRNLWKESELKNSLFAPWRERCEYEALCEGDDYWIDGDKLQNQVSFLDSHQEYSASATNSKVVDCDGNAIRLFSEKPTRTISTLGEIALKRQFHTATVVFRSTSLKKSIYNNYSGTYDTFMWCCLVSIAPLYYLKEVTSIYRKGSGVTSTTRLFNWCLQVEEWANKLYDGFSSKGLSWADAYSTLLCDTKNTLLNCELTKNEIKQLQNIVNRYNSKEILHRNLRLYVIMYLSWIKRSIKRTLLFLGC